MKEYQKPVPEVKDYTRPYWDGCKAHKLLLPKCRPCNKPFFFPGKFCPTCLSEDIEWTPASGKGTIHTFSVVDRPPSGAFAGDVPYVVAIIDLAEGPRMMSNVIGISPDEVRVGMPVEVVFEDINDDIAIPKFRPVQ
ncbi:MAG: Zn-ribbon domain-containing OB-fold protein [Candidatus Abyssobacteria bacterium SURF_17]|uniref:Zn-ribbon domain-containing OB-fold protein n=1 Tax=Candidatus Abyssobacteria bacterium SURF_17 TaxID=2093361 RepID=A0A419F2N0_9BACT|nr:MAG: Zn-ribbon domain-containing OB-fold protein [Candidatus Abyssubacteria bacterium SURF_17]